MRLKNIMNDMVDQVLKPYRDAGAKIIRINHEEILIEFSNVEPVTEDLEKVMISEPKWSDSKQNWQGKRYRK